jgi:hypothetical protein
MHWRLPLPLPTGAHWVVWSTVEDSETGLQREAYNALEVELLVITGAHRVVWSTDEDLMRVQFLRVDGLCQTHVDH